MHTACNDLVYSAFKHSRSIQNIHINYRIVKENFILRRIYIFFFFFGKRNEYVDVSSSLLRVSEILYKFIIMNKFFIEREPIYNVSLRRFDSRALQLKLFSSIHFFLVISGEKKQMKSCLCERNFKNTRIVTLLE